MIIKKKRKLSKKEERAKVKKTTAVEVFPEKLKSEESSKKRPVIEIGNTILVRDFASLLSLPVTEVIKVLMKNGVLKTINESIDWETASIVGDELGFEITLKQESAFDNITKDKFISEQNLVPRPPIVTVMGHVDHGKTKLLDVIRQTDIVSTEAGGITQHIGAYQVEYKGKKITFIDTPGHEAFETMRAHGANITDIVVLVVAADEGVKPQTIEAYEHAKKAGVEILVAINKIDLPTANIQRVKHQLSEIGLVCEDLGGKTVCVPISAKQNKNIDELLEMILLIAEMKNYKADPRRPAFGVVIESHLDQRLGPVASLLIQDGTLKEGDFVVVGNTWGKIRLMEDEHKRKLKKAGPSCPVKIAGIKELPSFGQVLQVVPDEKTAQIVLNDLKKMAAQKTKQIFASAQKEFPVILKTDVFGSLSAIKDNLKKISSEEISINIVKEGVGDVTDDDVMMAKASHATIYGFRVKTLLSASKIAQKEKVKILHFDVIYDLINNITKTLTTILKKDEENPVAKAEILKIFRDNPGEKIIGIRVLEGKITKGLKFKIDDKGGRVISLQIQKEKVDEVKAGQEAGLGLATESELEVGDLLVFY